MKKLTTILLFISAALFAKAEPVTLTNAEASRLFIALRTTQSGLSPANTRNVALNINRLRPFVEAFEAGQRVVQERASKLTKDPDIETKSIALRDEAQALSKASLTVDVALFILSDDEVRDAKVAADSLAEFLRFLSPAKK